MRKRLRKKKTCSRCGVIHTRRPFNVNKVYRKASKELSDEVDKRIIEEILSKPLDTNPNF